MPVYVAQPVAQKFTLSNIIMYLDCNFLSCSYVSLCAYIEQGKPPICVWLHGNRNGLYVTFFASNLFPLLGFKMGNDK